jgi:hypothetical protein
LSRRGAIDGRFDVSAGHRYRLYQSMQSRAPSAVTLSGRLCLAVFAAGCCTIGSFGQTALVGNSPFAPSGNAAVQGSAPAQDYELSGATSEDQQVSVCIYERQAKRSEWIPVGGNVDGIHVISFDNNHDMAVVMVGGQRKEITMRKAKIAKSESAVAPRPAFVADNTPAAPIASAPQPLPPAATAPEQEQREARMLVSDLLEIGVQQRKAYQDAKLKAASGQAPAPGN